MIPSTVAILFREGEYQFSIVVLLPFSDSILGAVFTCLIFAHKYT